MGNADGDQHAGRTRARHQCVELRPGIRPAHGQGAVAARTKLEDHGAHAHRGRWARSSSRAGAAPERPIFAVRPGARGDLTPAGADTTSAGLAWSKTGRGSYMPTPLAYDGLLYVLANNGVFDAYRPGTGEEVYRQRLPHPGSGFSASPVASDGKIYLANEDGEILVVAAGPEFKHLATNTMGELLMATPAISDGVMYVRSVSTLWAIGRK